jgi:predicted transcriptional regulator of viral defense system
MPQDRQDLRRRLAALARTQSGYFTAAQAIKLGYSYPAQSYHANRGNWLRVDHGIYRLPEWPVGPHDDLVRWHLWSRDRAVVSHDTALSVYELGEANPAKVHLTVPPDFHQKAPNAVFHTDSIPDSDVETRDGYKITTPLRTLLDVAAGDLEEDRVQRSIREAVESGLVSRRALVHRAESFGPRAALQVERALTPVPA